MKQKGLVLILIAAALVAVGIAIMKRQAVIPEPAQQVSEQTAQIDESSFSWRLETVESGEDLAPRTRVALIADGKVYDAGSYAGSCAEIAEENLLPGEVTGVLCWWAGGGDEIAVFRDEDLNYYLMHGVQEESTAEGDGFRGDFKELAIIE